MNQEKITEFKKQLQQLQDGLYIQPIFVDGGNSRDYFECPLCEMEHLYDNKFSSMINIANFKHYDDCPTILIHKLIESFEEITNDVIFVPRMRA